MGVQELLQQSSTIPLFTFVRKDIDEGSEIEVNIS